jgi:hypothetical protein
MKIYLNLGSHINTEIQKDDYSSRWFSDQDSKRWETIATVVQFQQKEYLHG